MERRHQQLRAKQRTRPEIPATEATRARSTSCAASSAFIPEGERVPPGQIRKISWTRYTESSVSLRLRALQAAVVTLSCTRVAEWHGMSCMLYVIL